MTARALGGVRIGDKLLVTFPSYFFDNGSQKEIYTVVGFSPKGQAVRARADRSEADMKDLGFSIVKGVCTGWVGITAVRANHGD